MKPDYTNQFLENNTKAHIIFYTCKTGFSSVIDCNYFRLQLKTSVNFLNLT